MKRFVFAALLLFVATTAQGQGLAVQGGGAQDWIYINGQWEELLSPLAGISYDIVLAEDGSYGLSVAMRAAKGTLDVPDTEEATITQYGLEYWKVQEIEWFFGGQVDTWGDGFTGEREFLGGVRGGLRFEAIEGTPFELSGHYSIGNDELKHAGVFFGVRRSGG
jgi:hypothetical protein